MRIKTLGAIGALISTAMLGGCATQSSSFGCDKVAGDGLGCASVMQTYDVTNHQAGGEVSQDKVNAPKLDTKSKRYSVNAPLPGDPVRFGEQIQRIWIAPFVDQEGIYHEPSYIYMVLTPSHWIGVPVKAVQQENQS
jgi:conjugal transfer pilus assembly protein TraV